ncbi:hypothetical protein ACOME3_009021 [Neoechinorhynchus agilis]
MLIVYMLMYRTCLVPVLPYPVRQFAFSVANVGCITAILWAIVPHCRSPVWMFEVWSKGRIALFEGDRVTEFQAENNSTIRIDPITLSYIYFLNVAEFQAENNSTIRIDPITLSYIYFLNVAEFQAENNSTIRIDPITLSYIYFLNVAEFQAENNSTIRIDPITLSYIYFLNSITCNEDRPGSRINFLRYEAAYTSTNYKSPHTSPVT